MSILGSLFRPKEVKDVLYAIDHLAKSGLSECLCFNEIQSSARSAVLSSPEAVKDQIVIEGKSPLEVALTLIVNLCGRDLASGHFHTYRGCVEDEWNIEKTALSRCARYAGRQGLYRAS